MTGTWSKRVVFAEAYDEAFVAVGYFEVEVGHASAQGFDANRMFPAGQLGDTICSAIGHGQAVFRVKIEA